MFIPHGSRRTFCFVKRDNYREREREGKNWERNMKLSSQPGVKNSAYKWQQEIKWKNIIAWKCFWGLTNKIVCRISFCFQQAHRSIIWKFKKDTENESERYHRHWGERERERDNWIGRVDTHTHSSKRRRRAGKEIRRKSIGLDENRLKNKKIKTIWQLIFSRRQCGNEI